MDQIADLLEKIESKIPLASASNESVSKSNVGWHLDHSVRVIISVVTALQKSDKNHTWRFNFKRMLLLGVKIIQRGKARAPKAVQSFDEITATSIQQLLLTAHSLTQELGSLDTKSNFMHPYVGQLNLKEAIIFLGIHTKHHLKIIDDIVKK